MIVQDILDIIEEQTRDLDNVTWTLDDVVGYINEGVKNIIQRAPQANSKKEMITAVAGIEQSIPNDGVAIINIIATADDDDRVGSIIHRVDVEQKDSYSPAWRNDRARSIAIEWMKRSSPTKFLLWPPLSDDTQVYAEYSYYPADLTGAGDLIIIANEYNEPVRLWALYRTFSRDSQDTPSVKRAADYKLEFEAFFK